MRSSFISSTFFLSSISSSVSHSAGQQSQLEGFPSFFSGIMQGTRNHYCYCYLIYREGERGTERKKSRETEKKERGREREGERGTYKKWIEGIIQGINQSINQECSVCETVSVH